MILLVKIKIFIMLILLSSSLFAQNNIDEILNLQASPNSSEEYCVQTIFNKLNNSSIFFQDFLQKKIQLSEEGESEYKLKNGIGTIKTTYINSFIHSLRNIDINYYMVDIEYSVFPIENDLFVEKLDIWGNWENVAKIFILYYPTTLNIEYLKNNKSEITSYYIEDRAIFSSEMVGGNLIGRIKVRNTSGKDYKKFIKEYEQKKQEFSVKMEIARQDSIKNEEAKLKAFLLERKTKIYTLSELSKTDYNNLLTQIIKESNSFINNTNSLSFYITGTIKINIDTNSVVKFNTESIKSDNQEQLSMLIRNISNSLEVKASKINGYYVNSELSYDVNISYKKGHAFFKIDKSNNLIFSEPQPTDKVKNEIENKYKKSKIGKYEITYEILSNENIPTKSNLTLIKYKKTFKLNYIFIALGLLL